MRVRDFEVDYGMCPEKAQAELLSEMWFNTALSILTGSECKSAYAEFYIH